MKKLFVFIGKPGSGKSTLIRALFPNLKTVDVLPFVLAHHDGNEVTDGAAIRGYHDMYEHLQTVDESEVVIELGTNHPELNISELVKLSADFKVTVFLLDAAIDVCRQRVHARSLDQWSEHGLERRLLRDFPNSHVPLLTKANLTFHTIDTNGELSDARDEIYKYL